MKILDNARIVAYLTDKEIGSVWHCAEDLILSVERSEKKLECLEQHKNCNECLSFECIGGLDFGAIEHFNGKWRKAIESLNLDDLHKWLVDDSKDKTEMEFRLNKVKGIVGNMWDNNELKQLHNKLNGTFETGGIVPRMINAITALNENETEESATETVNKWWKILSVIMFNIKLVQSRMQSIINETESILNPQLNSITEQEQPKPITQSSILKDPEIKAVLQAVEKNGLCVQRDGLYYWTGDNVLLSYLCSQISQYKDFSRQMRGDDYLPDWTKFEKTFMARGRKKGKWVEVTHLKLGDYKKGYMRNHDDFSPDGSKDIDRIIVSNIKI